MDLLILLLAWFGGCAMAALLVAALLSGASRFRRKMYEAWRQRSGDDGD